METKDIIYTSIIGALTAVASVGITVAVMKSKKEVKPQYIMVNIPKRKTNEEKIEELKYCRKKKRILDKEFNDEQYLISDHSLNINDMQKFDFPAHNYKLSVLNQAKLNNDIRIIELEVELKVAGIDPSKI